MSIPIWPTSPGNWGGGTSPFGSYSATGTTLSTTVTLGTGWWFVINGAHNTVQVVPVSGTTTATAVAASAAGFVFSDGATTLIVNDGTGGTAAHYAQILGL